jgi:hypothetical protein
LFKMGLECKHFNKIKKNFQSCQRRPWPVQARSKKKKKKKKIKKKLKKLPPHTLACPANNQKKKKKKKNQKKIQKLPVQTLCVIAQGCEVALIDHVR